MEGIATSNKQQEAATWLVERAKQITRVASLFTLSFIPAAVLYNSHEQQMRYDKHIEMSMSFENKVRLNELMFKTTSELGEEVVELIKSADRDAFSERDGGGSPAEPELKNMDKLSAAIEIEEDHIDFILNEKTFPKNFINGEIDMVLFFGEDVEANERKPLAQYYTKLGKNIITFTNKFQDHINLRKEVTEILTDGNQKDFKGVILEAIRQVYGHELGHANDWTSDGQLNLLERFELLDKIMTRINDPNIINQIDVGDKPIFRVAREYWANMVSSYLNFPNLMKEEHPEDFDLVDNFMKTQDQTFNTYDKAGPYFDDHGEPNQKFKTLLTP